MSLRWYRRPRLVVLKPDSPVLEAARAIEHNRIGAVVIQDKGRVVGIVTDRDLALRVIGDARDASTTRIADVMTPHPVTLAPRDNVMDAIRIMQEQNIRRIPLVENERVVGMVTLDDLLLDEAAPLGKLSAIVQSQIAEGGPAPMSRTPARRRSLARANATLARLLTQVGVDTDLDAEQSRIALDVVLTSLVRRLIPQEAKNLVAQLPSLLRPDLLALPPGPDKTITETSVVAELRSQLNTDSREARRVLATVAQILAGSISNGQAEDVRGQLPAGLRDLFRYPEPLPLMA